MARRNRILAGIQSLYSSPSPGTGFMAFSGEQVALAGSLNNAGNQWEEYLYSGGADGAGSSGVQGLRQLYRVQSADWDFTIPRQNVPQFGQFAPIDQIILQSPTVTLNFSYLLANFYNEASGLGFTVSHSGTGLGTGPVDQNRANNVAPLSAISGILTKVTDEKNYFLKISREGIDSVGDTETTLGNIQTVGIGNGFLSSYGVNLSVGQLPVVTVGVEALNVAVANGMTGQSPAVTPSDGVRVSRLFRIPVATEDPGAGVNDSNISALRPGDVVLSLTKRAAGDTTYGTLGYDVFGADVSGNVDNIVTNGRVQNCNISFNLTRDAIEKLGSKFAVSREITFPVEINATMDVIATDFISGDLSALINCDNQYDISVGVKRPATCGSTSQPLIVNYIVKGAKLNSENSRLTIDGNQTISLSFTSQVGGPNQTNIGLYLSGHCRDVG